MAEKVAEATDACIETNQPSTSGGELQTCEMYEVVDRLFFGLFNKIFHASCSLVELRALKKSINGLCVGVRWSGVFYSTFCGGAIVHYCRLIENS